MEHPTNYSANTADQCIVCLDDLNVVVTDTVHGEPPDDAGAVAAATSTPSPTPSYAGKTSNNEQIALIKPCNHVLHDECLRAWSQKANSCPICRQTFNVVDVLDRVGGTVISQYLVEDKKQVAQFDHNAWIQETLEEEEQSTPCPICGSADNEDVLLLCDACDAPYHTYCVDLDRVPRGHWFCIECADNEAFAQALENESSGRAQAVSVRNQPRTQASVRRTRRQIRTDQWMGAWSTFSNTIHDVTGLDLDFPDDDQAFASYRMHSRRTAAQEREFRQWQQRLNIASRQGARDVFRQAVPNIPEPPTAESTEVAQAWSALERAQQMSNGTTRNRRRRTRSETASPVEPLAMPKEPERKLKRPRTRRIFEAADSSTSGPRAASSRLESGQAIRRESLTPGAMPPASEEPSFLTQLLKEVETPLPDDEVSRHIFSTHFNIQNGAYSPSMEHSSPAASPSPPSSACHSPRALSTTPPPHVNKRPGSPLPLSSHIEPMFPPAKYTPNQSSPEASHHKSGHGLAISLNIEVRQPRPRRRAPVPPIRPAEQSPARATMSIEAKAGINSIVKSALAPHWKAAELSKEQYERINRDISRNLYDIVADRNFSDEKNRCVLERIATEKVAVAMKRLAT